MVMLTPVVRSQDRTVVDLPAVQHALAAAIAATGKPTAIFLLHGGMVGRESSSSNQTRSSSSLPS